MKYYIGVDIGSTSTKGVLMDRDRNIIRKDSRLHELTIIDGISETWAESFFKESMDIIGNLIQKVNIFPGDIESITFSGFESVSFIGKGGIEVHPTITYLDSRSEAIAHEFTKLIDPKELFIKTKNRASSIFEGYKAMYALRNIKAPLNQIKLLDVAHYCVFRLTGKYVMDHTSAMLFAPFYNVSKSDWDHEMLELANLNPDILPTLMESYEIAGTVNGDSSDKFNLSRDTLVTAGAQDAYASLLADGVLDKGESSFIYATSGVYDVVHDGTKFDNIFANTRHIIPGRYVSEAAMYNAGSLLNWFGKIIRKNLSKMDTIIEKRNRPGKIISLPFFTGERAPIWNNKLKGSFYYVDFSNDIYDFYLSLMEGVGYWLKYTIEKFNSIDVFPKSIVAGGGGSKSTIWTQIVSDIVGLPQEIKVSEGAAQGDGFISLYSSGEISSFNEIRDLIKIRKNVTPNTKLKGPYEKQFNQFKKLLEISLSEIYN